MTSFHDNKARNRNRLPLLQIKRNHGQGTSMKAYDADPSLDGETVVGLLCRVLG